MAWTSLRGNEHGTLLSGPSPHALSRKAVTRPPLAHPLVRSLTAGRPKTPHACCRGGGELAESFRHRHATHLLTPSLNACATDKLQADATPSRVPWRCQSSTPTQSTHAHTPTLSNAHPLPPSLPPPPPPPPRLPPPPPPATIATAHAAAAPAREPGHRRIACPLHVGRQRAAGACPCCD